MFTHKKFGKYPPHIKKNIKNLVNKYSVLRIILKSFVNIKSYLKNNLNKFGKYNLILRIILRNLINE